MTDLQPERDLTNRRRDRHRRVPRFTTALAPDLQELGVAITHA